MRENLDDSLKLLFGSEGGYSNRSTDAGGPTKYGITLKTLRAHRRNADLTATDVKALTLEEAEEIYRKSYWGQCGGDLLPSGLDYETMDFGVNSGPATAVNKLQNLVGVRADGIIGAQTLAAIDAYIDAHGINRLIVAYADARMAYLRSLGGKTGWRANGRGWTIRVTGEDPKGVYRKEPGVIGNALRLADRAKMPSSSLPVPAPRPVKPAEPKPVPAGKADPADTSIVETLKRPAAWGPLASLVTAGGALASGQGPVQWALAVAMVAGVAFGIYALVQHERRTA